MLLVVLFWAGNFTAMKLGFAESAAAGVHRPPVPARLGRALG